MSEFTPPYQSMRDTVNAFLQAQPALHALGLPEEDSVFQADTASSPAVRPFIVVRWGEIEAQIGDSRAQSGTLWVYDDFGDYNRPSKIALKSLELMKSSLIDIRTADGRISQIRTGGIGTDLADDGFKALVIPAFFTAIGNGA